MSSRHEMDGRCTHGEQLADNGAAPSLHGRKLAGAPISWGVCEVPGWGRMLPAERVLSEMASLGLRATEMGPVGYLPSDPAELRALLAEARHRPRRRLRPAGSARAVARPGTCGARRPHAAHDGPRRRGARRRRGDRRALVPAHPAGGGRLGAHRPQPSRTERAGGRSGLRLALHPHAGTLVETAEDIDAVLAQGEVDWCLDTGHLAIGGTDPVEFAAGTPAG